MFRLTGSLNLIKVSLFWGRPESITLRLFCLASSVFPLWTPQGQSVWLLCNLGYSALMWGDE